MAFTKRQLELIAERHWFAPKTAREKFYAKHLCKRGLHTWKPLETMLWCGGCGLWEDEV